MLHHSNHPGNASSDVVYLLGRGGEGRGGEGRGGEGRGGEGRGGEGRGGEGRGGEGRGGEGRGREIIDQPVRAQYHGFTHGLYPGAELYSYMYRMH